MELIDIINIVGWADAAAEKPNVFTIVSWMVYIVLALIALWGAFCVVMVWGRVAKKRFRTEEQQEEFLEAIGEPLSKRDFDGAAELCEADSRAIPQLAYMAIENRELDHRQVRTLMIDRFQRDVLGDLEHRLTWVNTVIKSAPMVGLFGTVLGMMGAFDQLSSAEQVEASAMAGNIMVALITTACGLAIAVPLIIAVASISIRIKKMEDLVGRGLSQFLAMFRDACDDNASVR